MMAYFFILLLFFFIFVELYIFLGSPLFFPLTRQACSLLPPCLHGDAPEA